LECWKKQYYAGEGKEKASEDFRLKLKNQLQITDKKVIQRKTFIELAGNKLKSGLKKL